MVKKRNEVSEMISDVVDWSEVKQEKRVNVLGHLLLKLIL
jgi:hypothetical protein